MSRGIEAYLVRPDAIRAAIGSADAGLVYAVGQAGLSADDRAAVVDLIKGKGPVEQPIRALRHLCLVLGGQMLANHHWMPCNTAYIDAVDRSLKAAGVEARIWQLASGITFADQQFGVELGPEARVAGYSSADVRVMHGRFAGSEAVAADIKPAVAQAASWFAQAADAGAGLLILEV